MKILLGSKEYLDAVNKDFQFNVGFKNKKNNHFPSEISDAIDELKVFDRERNEGTNYLLYGKVEQMVDPSLFKLYDLSNYNYDISIGYVDRYLPIGDGIDILSIDKYIHIPEKSSININDIIIIKSTSGFIVNKVLEKYNINGELLLTLDNMNINVTDKIIPSTFQYNRYFKEIISEDYLKFYKSGFSTNIFGDQILQYNTYKDIDIKGLKDNLNNPITSLYLKYKPKFPFISVFKNNLKTNTMYGNIDISNIDYTVEDGILDRVELNLNELNYEVLDEICCKFSHQGTEYYLKKYNENKIKVHSTVMTEATINTLFTIPDYGFHFKNGDINYKELLNIGYFEGENGVDYPFINGLHYVYNDIKFIIRRVLPIASYVNRQQLDDNIYDNNLINSEVTSKRLC